MQSLPHEMFRVCEPPRLHWEDGSSMPSLQHDAWQPQAPVRYARGGGGKGGNGTPEGLKGGRPGLSSGELAVGETPPASEWDPQIQGRQSHYGA